MNPGLVADSIVNACGAIGIVVAMMTIRRRDPRGSLTRRLMFALGLVAGLLVTRTIGWWFQEGIVVRVSLALAGALPLGVLVVTEGVLRRHAPWTLKVFALGASGVLAFGGALGLDGIGLAYDVGLALAQVVTLFACGWLLARRDTSCLTVAENRIAGRMMLAMLVATPFLLTDFRMIFPDIPVRIGALGALFVVNLLLMAGEASHTRMQHLSVTSLRIASAVLLGAAASAIGPEPDLHQVMRYCAVSLSGVLAIGLMVDTLRRLYDARSPGLLASIAAKDGRRRDELVSQLQGHPLFEGSRRLAAADLGDYDPAILSGFLKGRSVLRQADHPWGQDARAAGVERTASLIASLGATHLIVIDDEPLDLLVVTVPVVLADTATETALSMVRRLLSSSEPGNVPGAIGHGR